MFLNRDKDNKETNAPEDAVEPQSYVLYLMYIIYFVFIKSIFETICIEHEYRTIGVTYLACTCVCSSKKRAENHFSKVTAILHCCAIWGHYMYNWESRPENLVKMATVWKLAIWLFATCRGVEFVPDTNPSRRRDEDLNSDLCLTNPAP